MAGRPSKSSHQPILLAKKIEIIKAVDSKKKSTSLILQGVSVSKSSFHHHEKNKKILGALESSCFLPVYEFFLWSPRVHFKESPF